MKTCTVDGCDNLLRARGYCATHWARWRKYGTTELPTQPTHDECTVDGCGSKPRSKHSPYCEMHYYRIRRNGSTATVKPRVKGDCVVDGCDRAAERVDGYCRMHYLRLTRRGDLRFEMRGAQHPKWTGEAATSGAAHGRIKATRGSARSWACTDCARPAAHWSYDHADPEERYDPDKGYYSLEVDHYFPRCVRCHKSFDLTWLAIRAAM